MISAALPLGSVGFVGFVGASASELPDPAAGGAGIGLSDAIRTAVR